MQVLRYAVFPLTLISLFVFPWTVTLLGMAGSALVYPPTALFIGIIADLLYYPGVGLPMGGVWGAGLTILAYLVRYFVKTRML